MIKHRTLQEVRAFDWFKLIVALILLIILLWQCSSHKAVAPTINSVNSASPVTLTGTGAPNSKVKLMWDGKELGTADVDSHGKWSLPNISFPAGKQTVQAYALDADGKMSAESTSAALNILAPINQLAIDMPTITAGTPTTLTGVGVPGGKVRITTPEGVVLGTADVGTDGKWSLPNLNLDGVSNVIATALDGSGNPLAAPSPVNLQLVADPLTIDMPDFAAGKTVTLTGLGTPGAKVQITAPDGKVLGEATVGADGRWSLPNINLEGLDGVTATLLGADGKALTEPAPFVLSLPKDGAPSVAIDAPAAPLKAGTKATLTGTTKDAAGKTVKIYADGKEIGTATVAADGTWSADVNLPLTAKNVHAKVLDGTTVLATSNNLNLLEQSIYALTVPKNNYVYIKSYYKNISIWGKGKAGEKLVIYQNGTKIGDVTVRSDGRWRLPIATPAVGKYKFTARRPGAANDLGLSSNATVIAKPKR